MRFMQLRQLSQTKHLRGKHDQRDHGRRGIGQGSGGVSSAVASITSLTPEQTTSITESYRSVTNQVYNAITKESTDPRDRLDRVRDTMKMQERKTNDEVKQRNALLRTIDRRVKKGGEPASQSERDRIRTLDEGILSSATSFEFLREQYNAELTTFRAQQRQAAKDRAKAKRDQAKNPIPTPTLELTPKPESLQGFGLNGWTRFRPDTPPDYSAYDQAIPGRPAWMNEPRLNDLGNTQISQYRRPPRNFRRVTQTPEGDPVLMVGGKNIIERMSVELDKQKTSKEELAKMTDNPWMSRIWKAGERLFSKQNSDPESLSFWNQTPGQDPKDIRAQTIADSVGRYGGAGYRDINDFLRRTHKFTAPLKITNAQVNTRNMDAGMQPAPATIFARRGVGQDTFQRMQQHLRVGDRFTDDVFTSASVNPMFNWSNDKAMFNIIITEGTPTLWTDSHKPLKEEENEVIIGRGVTYEVVSTDNERGWILRTVPPEGDYVPPEIPTS